LRAYRSQKKQKVYGGLGKAQAKKINYPFKKKDMSKVALEFNVPPDRGIRAGIRGKKAGLIKKTKFVHERPPNGRKPTKEIGGRQKANQKRQSGPEGKVLRNAVGSSGQKAPQRKRPNLPSTKAKNPNRDMRGKNKHRVVEGRRTRRRNWYQEKGQQEDQKNAEEKRGTNFSGKDMPLKERLISGGQKGSRSRKREVCYSRWKRQGVAKPGPGEGKRKGEVGG